jgi:FkbM family methyltransferase
MTMNDLITRVLRRMRVMAPVEIVVGPGKGLRFDPGPSNADYASGNNELPVQQALVDHLRAGSVFFDVGANVGFLTVLGAKLVGPAGSVYAFEPVSANADYVRRNCRINGFTQVHVLEKAVSNHCGQGQLNLAAYSGGAALASVDAPPDPAGTQTVDLVTIDASVERDGLAPPHLIKIDVEGAELEVLQGMTATAARHRPIVIVEVDSGEAEALRRKQADCTQWLQQHGYQVRELLDSYVGARWLVKHIIGTPA